MVQKLSELESALSAAPAEVTELIDSLKGEVSSEGGKDMVTRLKSLLNKDRKCVKDEVTQSKSMLNKLLQGFDARVKNMTYAYAQTCKELTNFGNVKLFSNFHTISVL